MAKGTDVQAASAAEVQTSERPDPQYVALVKKCLDNPGEMLPARDGHAINAAIQQRMAEAQTPEELDALLEVSAPSVTGAKDGSAPPLTGQPLRIRRVDFTNSDEAFREQNPDGLGIFAIIEGETEQGGHFVRSCGGRTVVRYLARRWEMGWLPVDVVIFPSATTTAAGFRPLNIRPVEFKAEEPF